MKKQILTLALFITACFVACKKENDTTDLRIRLTDAPTALEEVNIDLQEVQINFSQDSSGWVKMNTRAGIYNLLGLQNGVDTLIAQGTYPTRKVQEIRFVLGPNNTVKDNGATYGLTIPSGATSGLKLKINHGMRAELDSLVIDFDAAMSVSKETDGYKLRPVLREK
jgi:hypothetical protein